MTVSPDGKHASMMSAVMLRWPGPISVPVPSGEVFHTLALYPVLVMSTVGMSAPVTTVTADNVPGRFPVPPLPLKTNEYRIGTHSGYRINPVSFPKNPSMKSASIVRLPKDKDVPDVLSPVFQPTML